MVSVPPLNPLPYSADLENPDADDPETRAEVVATICGIVDGAFERSGHARRAVHAKSHGLLVGEAEVLPDLPEPYRQGLFAKPATYPLVMRFSTLPCNIISDEVSLPRGLGLKIVGVEGERLPDFPDDVTQDFLLATGDAFPSPTADRYARALRLFAEATEKPEFLKRAVAGIAKAIAPALENFGVPAALFNALGAYPPKNVLNDAYFSQGALLFGRYVAKLSVAPVSPALKALGLVDLSTGPNALREAVAAFFAREGGEWELRAQLCVDAKAMPIEDPSAPWSEEKSPYVPVARLRAPPQPAWSEDRSRLIDDAYSFTPWRGLAAHRPLGSVMRARRSAYAASANRRAERNGLALREPRSAADLPSAAG